MYIFRLLTSLLEFYDVYVIKSEEDSASVEAASRPRPQSLGRYDVLDGGKYMKWGIFCCGKSGLLGFSRRAVALRAQQPTRHTSQRLLTLGQGWKESVL